MTDDATHRILDESWQRSRECGVEPDVVLAAARRVSDEVLARRRVLSAELVAVARPHLEWLAAAHGGVSHVVLLVDRDGIVLETAGTADGALYDVGRAGSDWTESAIGTNAIGTALAAGVPVAVGGAEHVVRALQAYAGAAVPVQGAGREIAGAIGVLTPLECGAPPCLMALAHAAFTISRALEQRGTARRFPSPPAPRPEAPAPPPLRPAMLEALQESEARFRVAFDDVAVGMAIVAPDGRWTRANRALCEILGYTERELADRPFQSLIHADDFSANVELLREVLAGATDRCRLEQRLIHKAGYPVWVSMDATAVRDAGGTTRHLIAQFQDVTERRRAEAALRASEARYEHVAANAPGMVYQFVYRPDGSSGYTFVSEGARTIFGVAPEAALEDASVLLDLVHPEDRPEFRDLALTAARALGPFRWDGRVVLPSGEERFVQIAARDFEEVDGSIVSDGVLMDVTEMRRAARRLEESEQRHRSLFDHHPDAVFSFDAEGRFVSGNPACEAIAGYLPAELLGQAFAPIIDPEYRDAALAHLQTALAGTACNFETMIRHKSGHRVELDVTNIPVVVGGRVVGVFGIARDLSTQRALEAKLRQAAKMEAVGRLAGGVAHDFNNLLTVITSYTMLLLGELPAETPWRPDLRADLGKVLKAAERGAALTQQLLAFGRKQVLQPRQLDVNTTTAEMATMLRRVIGEDIVLEVQLAPAVWPIYADAGQLEQVLMNLAVNARDAMPDGGVLRLRTANVSVGVRREGTPGGLAAGDYVSIAVEDSGVGIDPAVMPHLFEPFFTTKELGKGTGLGLATVHGIVEQSGGGMTVDSTPGQGSCFTILLPRSRTMADVGTAGAARATLPRGTETILLVEDEDAVRAVVRRLLERLGYTVCEAATGVAALQLIEAGEVGVDLVLTDVVMPELSGRGLAEALEVRHPDLRVLYMSGYTDDESLRHGPTQRGMQFLQKPFTPEGLAYAVRQAIDGSGALPST